MNRETISVECAHKLCSSCTFEDCACECHAEIDEPDDFGIVVDPEEVCADLNINYDQRQWR